MSVGKAGIERPGKIICVGLNYRDHAEESGLEIPENPLLFAKWPNAIIGDGDPIVLPAISKQVDYEAELGVVIGSRVRAADRVTAMEAVAGFVCFNDVTARDLQFSDVQWTRAKSLDTFAPMGPEVVPPDSLDNPQELAIRCRLNGEVVQDSSTTQMLFPVADLIAFASEAITLEAGDLIATGTPAGVGFARKPPLYLKPGDEVSVEIEGVGVITNPVLAPCGDYVSQGPGGEA